MTFQPRHLVAAVVLHSAVLFLVGAGVQCSGKVHKPVVISAVLLDPSRQEVARQKREEQRRAEERRRREEEARHAEQQRKAQADAAAKKKLEDARQAKLAADQKRAAEQKQAADLKKMKEADARREADAKARLAEAMRAEEVQRELDREAMERAASEREVKLSAWVEQLTRHVKKNWIRPAGSGDFECRVRMQLLPDGTVTNAKIEKSCGSAQLDRSVEDAVYRASPLPKPSDPTVFDRDLTIRFVP